MDVSELWDLSIKFLWDDRFINGLESFLRANGAKTVLDSCGGTGFPSIALKKRGWDITYSDGSELMYNRFQAKMAAQGVAMPSYRTEWLGLSRTIPNRFDALLCRGNSLVYVNSWDRDKISQKSPLHIGETLQEFRAMLNPGGVLYIDIINKNEYDQPEYPVVEEIGERWMDGKRIRLTWLITHNYNTRLRTCQSVMEMDGVKHTYLYYSYLLRHVELLDLLTGAGFRQVREIKVEGEPNYTVFSAHT